jgi:hypothetical protein
MDPFQELLQLLMETQEEIQPRAALPGVVRAWHSGDTSGWQELLFGSESAQSEANRLDEMDRAVGAPVGTLREAWEMARARGTRRFDD